MWANLSGRCDVGQTKEGSNGMTWSIFALALACVLHLPRPRPTQGSF